MQMFNSRINFSRNISSRTGDADAIQNTAIGANAYFTENMTQQEQMEMLLMQVNFSRNIS
jgi:hypothetical protein